MTDADRNRPASVDVSLSAGVDIVWNDGHASHYAIAALRAACPCATCQDLHGTGIEAKPAAPALLPIFKPTGAMLEAVKPVGQYALNFVFSDGHSTGIFTWEYLRELCPCADCRGGKP